MIHRPTLCSNVPRSPLGALSLICSSLLSGCGGGSQGGRNAADSESAGASSTGGSDVSGGDTGTIALGTGATGTGSIDRCSVIQDSVSDAGFESEVKVTCDDEKAYFESDSYASHEMMTGISGTNEQIPVPAPGYTVSVKLNPTPASTVTTRDAALAIAVNGIPIFDYTAGGEIELSDLPTYNPNLDAALRGELDNCGGHAGKGDDYHYHVLSDCMVDQMLNKGDSAIVGWAFDGYPVYGKKNPDGTPLQEGELGFCGEKEDEVFGYRYHASDSFPFFVQCLVGEVDSDLPRVSPLRASDPSSASREGAPPRGGVQNLVRTEASNGSVSMTYQWEDEEYYINYEPSGTPNCYHFEFKTVTLNGQVASGEYCR